MTEEQPSIYQHITTVHQQVREFVQSYLEERSMPYIVTNIEGNSRSNYAPTLKTRDDLIPQYILTEVRETFKVDAESPRGHTRVGFEVLIDGNGKLRMGMRGLW